MANNGITKQGWLKKSSKNFGIKHKRWVVFMDSTLYTFKNMMDNFSNPTEILDLHDFKKIKNSNSKNNEFIIVNNDGNIRTFQAENKNDRDKWVECIQDEMDHIQYVNTLDLNNASDSDKYPDEAEQPIEHESDDDYANIVISDGEFEYYVKPTSNGDKTESYKHLQNQIDGLKNISTQMNDIVSNEQQNNINHIESKVDDSKTQVKQGKHNIDTSTKKPMIKMLSKLLKFDDIAYALSMNGMLERANTSLFKFLNPDNITQSIPTKLLSNAKGIVFLTTFKAGFLIGACYGVGIIMAKLDNVKQPWSSPCAIAIMGLHGGLHAGAQKTNFIIVLRTDGAVDAFSKKGQLKFGADVSIAAGPYGRDANVAMSINQKGFTPTVSYSMAKGVYLGISLEGQGIGVRNDCNCTFYDRDNIHISSLLNGNIKMPKRNKDFEGICRQLRRYIKTDNNNIKIKTKSINIIPNNDDIKTNDNE